MIQLGIILSTAGALFFTVRNFRKQLQLNFFAEYTKRYQEIILNFPRTITEEDFNIDNLSVEEKDKTLRYMRVYFDLCSEEYFLWQSKDISEKVWLEWESGIKYAMSRPAFNQSWEIIGAHTTYYKDFSLFIESITTQETK